MPALEKVPSLFPLSGGEHRMSAFPAADVVVILGV